MGPWASVLLLYFHQPPAVCSEQPPRVCSGIWETAAPAGPLLTSVSLTQVPRQQIRVHTSLSFCFHIHLMPTKCVSGSAFKINLYPAVVTTFAVTCSLGRPPAWVPHFPCTGLACPSPGSAHAAARVFEMTSLHCPDWNPPRTMRYDSHTTILKCAVQWF